MKKKLLYLLLLFSSGIAGAQIVNIPDPVFKNWLLTADTDNNRALDENDNPIVVDVNGDYEIQESEALLVWKLMLGGAGISDATGLEAFSNLIYLECSENPDLTSLDLTSLSDLERFIISSGTGLEFLTFAGLSNLEQVNITDTNLETIDFTGVTSVKTLVLENVPLISINFSEMFSLTHLWLSGTHLINVDLSNTVVLEQIAFHDNLFLESLNVKNGDDGLQFLIDGCPLLSFVCADEGEVAAFQEADGFESVSVSSYCSFTPGGDYNTITGTMIFDVDGNGCDTSDSLFSFFKIEINDGTSTVATFTNDASEYTFYTGAGDFTLTPLFENGWFTATPANVNFPDENNNVTIQDFCITSSGDHPDLEVVMEPIGTARPGFDAQYKVVYRNKGNQVLSGSVNCGWDYSILTGVAISPLPDGIVPGIYTWNFTDLMPFESREIVMTLNVNSPTDNPAVNPGDILPFTAAITAAGTDETPEDNAFAFDQVVVGSLDPNSITCIQGATAPTTEIGKYLHYVVDFENIGDAAATFVVVKHEINPEDFDISSLQILNSSHPMTARVTGNKVEFIFDNINLGALEHGNILFKLKSLNTLEEGDSVVNQADIFFDYNYPLATNEATTIFEIITSGLGDFELDNSVKIYPVPAQNQITIEAEGSIESVSLFDAQGRMLQTSLVNDRQAVLDISSRQAGIYFLKVTTAEGVKMQQIVKE